MRSQSTYGSQAYPYFLDSTRNASVQRRPFSSGSLIEEMNSKAVGKDVYVYDSQSIGHSDSVSPIEYNLVLSEEDAANVIHSAAFPSPELDSLPTPESMRSSAKLSPSLPEEPISVSPAARFLSSFSPSTNPIPLPGSEGEVVAGYTLGPIIGSGGFSTIRRASSPTGGDVVVKIVRHSDVSQQDEPELVRKRLDNEAAIWSTLCHEFILPLFATTRTDLAQYFVTLYCPAGSLFDILKRDGQPGLEQEEVGMMFRQVVGGLRYMHETVEIVHGDIKLENVLVDEMGVCRIADFGLSRRIREVDDEEWCEGDTYCTAPHQSMGPAEVGQTRRHADFHEHTRHRKDSSRNRNSAPLPLSPVPRSPEAHTFQPGSLPYASPELLRPRSSTNSVGPHPSQDIWALGIMLFALLTGHLPFMDAFEPRLQMKILRGNYDIPSHIGQGARRVLNGCLRSSASHRWNIAAIDEVAWDVGGEAADVTPIIRKEVAEDKRTPAQPLHTRTGLLDDFRPPQDRGRKYSLAPSDVSEASTPALTSRSTSSRSTSRQPVGKMYSALTASIRRASVGASSSTAPSFLRGRSGKEPSSPTNSGSQGPTKTTATPVRSRNRAFSDAIRMTPVQELTIPGFQMPPKTRRASDVRSGSKPTKTDIRDLCGEGFKRADTQARGHLHNEAKERRRVYDAGNARGRVGGISAVALQAAKEDAAPRVSESRGLDGLFRRPEKNLGAVPISIPLKSGAGTSLA